MRLIEFVASVRLGREQWLPKDRKHFSEEQAAEYIRLGWARDVESGEIGEHIPGTVTLEPDNLTQRLIAS